MKKHQEEMAETKLEEKGRKLEAELQADAAGGVRINKKQNTINMCSQMPNVHLFIKELAANASDAGASRFHLSGSETEEYIKLVCEDNGHGMNREGIVNYFTVYRSRKSSAIAASRSVHGTHGLGKLTVAKIPGQVGYKVVTSDGNECWEANTGILINCDEITIARRKEVPPAGTSIEISIMKSCPLQEYMKQLFNILREYVRFLQMEIYVYLPGDEFLPEESMSCLNDAWKPQYDPASIAEVFEYDGNLFDIVMGIGQEGHEVYQSRVLISRQYNLLSYDLQENWKISNLWIRLDSSSFRLPFGRHKLINEHVLQAVSRYIRENLLVRLIRYLSDFYPDNLEKEFGIRNSEFEELIFSLLLYDGNDMHFWFNCPVFKTVTGPNISLNDLIEIREEKEHVLMEDGDFDGVDFSLFEVPVLSKNQSELATRVLNEYFRKGIQRIGDNDLAFEPKAGEGPPLGEDALRFQETLGLKNHRSGYHIGYGAQNFSNYMTTNQHHHMQKLFTSVSVDESMRALRELQRIKWRVNYLVDPDGTSPSKTHLFIYRHGEIILNLNHPQMEALLQLSKSKPVLAGLFGMAVCLSDKRNVLPHLSADVREDLLTMDALLRAGEEGVEHLDDEAGRFEGRRNRYSSRYIRRPWLDDDYDIPF